MAIDPIDCACEREEEMRQDALAEQMRRAGLQGKTLKDSATRCDCGTAIPLARRKAIPGVQTCIECQTDLER